MVNSKSHRKGLYKPINKHKYVGDINNITYRSGWELGTCKYLDLNPDVQYWSSETAKVQYRCPTDNSPHVYYIDFTIKYTNGEILLVEVKPSSQTIRPKSSKGKSKATTLTENLAFIKNVAKWKSAHEYAQANGAKFVIWTEKYLKTIGVPCG